MRRELAAANADQELGVRVGLQGFAHAGEQIGFELGGKQVDREAVAEMRQRRSQR